MSTAEIRSRLEAGLDRLAGLDAVVRFEFDDGALVLDATASPPTLGDGDIPPDCTIRMSSADFLKLLDGKLSPMLAYTMGKLKVSGSTGIAMKLSSLLDSP
jgi:putative sterol carrier protein